MKPHERDFANLVNELLRLAAGRGVVHVRAGPGRGADQQPQERLLRGPALDRKAGRTNQTAAGAQRRSVIVSVLESLRVNLEMFNLDSVLEEVSRWMAEGISLFARQWQALLGSEPAAVPDTS